MRRALHGVRELDSGETEPVGDPDLRETFRRRGVRIALRAGLWAGALTAGALAIP